MLRPRKRKSELNSRGVCAGGLKAVTYARVSSKEQEKEGFSIPAQARLLGDYARQHGIVVAKEFVDIETAKQSGRTGFNEMLAFLAKNPEVQAILVEKTDRLYRNIRDWVTLDELRLEIHFVKENVVLSETSRSNDKFMHGIKVLMAKNYVDNLSEETRKGMTEKAEQGIWPSYTPLGYLNVSGADGKKTIAPDPVLAPLIVKAFEWYVTGNYNVKQLTVMLKENGFVFRNSQAPVPTSTIHKTLRHRIYTGEFEWNGKVYKGKYEPIISKELWQAVQDVIDGRLGGRRKKGKHNFAFSGLIECGHTGGYLVGELKKKKYVYYRAVGAKGIPYVKEEELERCFEDALNRLRFDEEVLSWIGQALRESHVDTQKFHEETLSRLQAEYKKLEGRINAMYVDKLDGKITDDFFMEKSAEWREEQNRIKERIDQLQAASENYLAEGVGLLELAQNAHRLFVKQAPSEKRRLLNFLVSNCVWKDGELTVTYKQPFDMLVEYASKPEGQANENNAKNGKFDKWLPGTDSNRRPGD